MDLLYMLITLYCITKLRVYCKLASELTGDDEEIKSFSRNHLKLVELISIADSALQSSIFIQLMSALGLFAFGSFQVRHGVDGCIAITFTAIMLQLSLYCFLSEYIYTLVRLG